MNKLIKDVFSVRTTNYLKGYKYVKDIDITKLRGGKKTKKEVMDYIQDNRK